MSKLCKKKKKIKKIKILKKIALSKVIISELEYNLFRLDLSDKITFWKEYSLTFIFKTFIELIDDARNSQIPVVSTPQK